MGKKQEADDQMYSGASSIADFLGSYSKKNYGSAEYLTIWVRGHRWLRNLLGCAGVSALAAGVLLALPGAIDTVSEMIEVEKSVLQTIQLGLCCGAVPGSVAAHALLRGGIRFAVLGKHH